MNTSEVADIRNDKEKDPDPITLGRLANALNLNIHQMHNKYMPAKSKVDATRIKNLLKNKGIECL